MIFIAAACLLAFSGVTAALAPVVSNAVGVCIRGAGDTRNELYEATDEPVPRQPLVEIARPQQRDIVRVAHHSSNNISVDHRSFVTMLQLQLQWQIARVDPFGTALRLCNCWPFIVFPPEMGASAPVSVERILLWVSGAMPPLRSSSSSSGGSTRGRGSGHARLLPVDVTRAAASVVPDAGAASAHARAHQHPSSRSRRGHVPSKAVGVAKATARPAVAGVEVSVRATPPAAARTPTITTTDVVSCVSSRSPPRSAESCRGRSRTREGCTSPRTRGGRPLSPRRVTVSPRPSRSPRRSCVTVSAAAGGASSASPPTTASQRDGPHAHGAQRSGQEPDLLKDVSAEQTRLDVEQVILASTPPLTPASALSSPDLSPSVIPSNDGGRAFFGDGYASDDEDAGGVQKDGTLDISLQLLSDADLLSMDEDGGVHQERLSEEVTRLSPQEQSDLQTTLKSSLDILDEDMDPGVDSERGCRAAVVVAGSGDGDGGGEVRVSGAISPGRGDFDPIVRGVEPGHLRRLLISNLRNSRWGGLGDGCARVRMSTMSLTGSEDANSVKGRLETVEVLGSGAFGEVVSVRHSILGGGFALKKLKEGACERERYCAKAEMIALARLAAAWPHENVISAVCIDDREDAIDTMPILFRRAEMDFADAVSNDECDMLGKLRCLVRIASGLQHVHEQGIGHGDIKPENILLYDDGKGGYIPRLCDFGFSRALGERRPPMMGTPGYMPLEVMSGSVETHASQDTFAMAAVALMVCVAPEKAQVNMFASPELYTNEEARQIKALEAWGGGYPSIAARAQKFEDKLTRRTMADGSFVKLMTVEHLHPDLGSRHVMDMVACCLPPFLDEKPQNRPELVTFRSVMESLAADVPK